jgi:hypothetical protein
MGQNQTRRHSHKVSKKEDEEESYRVLKTFSSVHTGANILTRGGLGKWADYFPSVAELFDGLRNPNREFHRPLRLVIDRTHSVKGIGTVFVGTILQGTVREGNTSSLPFLLLLLFVSLSPLLFSSSPSLLFSSLILFLFPHLLFFFFLSTLSLLLFFFSSSSLPLSSLPFHFSIRFSDSFLLSQASTFLSVPATTSSILFDRFTLP